MASNLSAATATLITSSSYALTIDPGIVDSHLWWKRVATRDDVWGAFAWTDWALAGNDYYPDLIVWVGDDADALTKYDTTPSSGALGFDVVKQAVQFQVVAGQTYWFEVMDLDSDYDAGDELQFSIQTAPREAIPAGSLFIPNDRQGFPALVLSQDDGAPLRAFAFPAGERGAVLPNGILCVNDYADFTTVRLYTPDFELIAVVEGVGYATVTDGYFPLIAADETRFYVFDVVDNAQVNYTLHVAAVSAAGAIEDTWSWTVATTGGVPYAVGVSPDGATLYWCRAAVATMPIERYDLVGDAPLATLAAAVASASGYMRDVIVLADGTVLVGYQDSPAGYVRRYSAAGAILNTYTEPDSDGMARH